MIGVLTSCPQCSAEFSVPEPEDVDLPRATTSLLRFAPASASTEEPSAIPEERGSRDIHVVKGGRELGPFKENLIGAMVDGGMLEQTDMVWHLGLPDWVPLHLFLERRPPLPIGASSGEAKSSAGRRSGSISTTAPRSGMALTSAFCGLLVILTAPTSMPAIAAVPALITGRLALAQIQNGKRRRSGFWIAKVGVVLGMVGIVLQGIIFLTGQSRVSRVRESATRVDSSSGAFEASSGRQITFSGVYLEVYTSSTGGMRFNHQIVWDFRSNGTVHQSEKVGGINAGGEGTYSVQGGLVDVVLEDDLPCTFQMEGDGDLISGKTGVRLVRLR